MPEIMNAWKASEQTMRIVGSASAADALRRGRMDWKVLKKEIFVEGVVRNTVVSIPDQYAIVRGDDNRVLGIVGRQFTVRQNADALGVLDPAIASGIMGTEYVGEIYEGRKVFLICIAARLVHKELIVANRGRGTLRAIATNSNDGQSNSTLQAFYLLDEVALPLPFEVELRHSAGVQIDLSPMNLMSELAETADRYQTVTRCMMKTKLSGASLDHYLEKTYHRKHSKLEWKSKAHIKSLVHGDQTLWDAFYAICQYEDFKEYHAVDAKNRRVNQVLFGSGRKAKLEAYYTAADFA